MSERHTSLRLSPHPPSAGHVQAFLMPLPVCLRHILKDINGAGKVTWTLALFFVQASVILEELIQL